MRYEDYMGNVAQLAVDLVNGSGTAELTGVSAEMLVEHGIRRPADAELTELLPPLRDALAGACDQRAIGAVNALLDRYPPELRVTDHDGPGTAHLHHAPDGSEPVGWLGRTCAAALAFVACGTPAVTLGRCQAAGCPRFFVDQSRNRSRRFCGNACASRTTVAAHRARTGTRKS